MEIPEKLNTVFLHEMSAKLTNAITECMISNQMTLECLELACNEVKYSLQGTTQGRYLTGGVPPVRFSM